MPRITVVVERDGAATVENIGRPSGLVAFGDKWGKSAPTTYGEVAWLAHRVLAAEVPFQEWLDSLDELTANDDVVERVQRELHAQLSPAERLEAMSAAEFVELARASGGAGHELLALVAAAGDELARRAEHVDEQAEAIAARVFLDTASEADLEVMGAPELERLRTLAAKAPEAAVAALTPTTRPPVTAGGGG